MESKVRFSHDRCALDASNQSKLIKRLTRESLYPSRSQRFVRAGKSPHVLTAYGPARSTISGAPLGSEQLNKVQAYWRACNYLTLGMIYLQDNPLLKEPLKPEHIKNRLLGHWGASPGLAFIYLHLNRLIKTYDLDMIVLAGPGRGAPEMKITKRQLSARIVLGECWRSHRRAHFSSAKSSARGEASFGIPLHRGLCASFTSGTS